MIDKIIKAIAKIILWGFIIVFTLTILKSIMANAL